MMEAGEKGKNPVVIINYGMGNSTSIQNIIHKVGGKATISSDADIILGAEKIILPGVGHFGKAMENISKKGLGDVLVECAVKQQKPVLGICLGMQLLTSWSEEGNVAGLDLIEAKTEMFRFEEGNYKVPHMGWNNIRLGKQHPYFRGLENSRFYFVHKYRVKAASDEHVLATTEYGGSYHSAIVKGNIVGVQFHPEKSHKFGMQFFRNFISA